MQLSHAVSGFENAVETQLRVAGPEMAEAGVQLMAALQPAIRQTLMDVVAMAATEVSSQLATQNVDIRLVDGDPELIVVDDDPGVCSACSESATCVRRLRTCSPCRSTWMMPLPTAP